MSLTDKQKQQRDNALGSSDAPVVCGLSPYKSPLVLYHEMRGDLERYSDEETSYQKIGSRLEPVIAELAAEELHIKIRRCPVRIHPKYKWMVAHPDFEIVSNAKGPGLHEIKNRAGQPPWEQVPEDVEIQTRHQMAASNREWAMVTGLFNFGVLRHYEIERDREIEDYIIEIEACFMLHVERGEPPDTKWDKHTLDLLKKLYPRDSGKTITLDTPEALAMVDQYLGTKEVLDDMKQQHDAAKGWLQSAMQDASTAIVPGYQLTWKSTKPSKHFDEDAFHEAHHDLYQQFVQERPGFRRFLVKPSKEIK